jgi:hypothetical protein
VRLPIAATDTYGHYDPSLTIDDVLVIENGEQQQIKVFSICRPTCSCCSTWQSVGIEIRT